MLLVSSGMLLLLLFGLSVSPVLVFACGEGIHEDNQIGE